MVNRIGVFLEGAGAGLSFDLDDAWHDAMQGSNSVMEHFHAIVKVLADCL